MRGDGSVTVGESMRRAVGRSVYLEMSARMQMQALALSDKVNYLDEAEVKASMPLQDYKRAWPMWREKTLGKTKAGSQKTDWWVDFEKPANPPRACGSRPPFH